MPHVRPSLIVCCGLALLALSLAACTPGGLLSANMMYAPHRVHHADEATFRSALVELSEGDREGIITLSEEQLTGLLRGALDGGGGDEGLVRDVQVWLEPDTVYIKVLLRQGALGNLPGEVALNLEGDLRTVDGRLRFDVTRAGVGAIPIASPALLDLFESQLKVAVGRLVDRASRLDVKVNSGIITIDLP